MIRRHYKKTNDWIDRNRHSLLLLSTFLVLVLPAFSGGGVISEFVFVVTLSFLFVQSMIAADIPKHRKLLVQVIVICLIIISWLKPFGINSVYVSVVKHTFIVAFYVFVVIHLLRFITRSATVTFNVLITSVNIFLLTGIIGASLAFCMYDIYPDAYSFPAHIQNPDFTTFFYYSFITMSTVGYGDITPKIPETQTLAYLISVTGQLYVAIILALLVGKFLVHSDQRN